MTASVLKKEKKKEKKKEEKKEKEKKKETFILPASTEQQQKNKLLHLSYHFSFFLTVSLLFKCRFVAWRRGFSWKFASCCLCHNK